MNDGPDPVGLWRVLDVRAIMLSGAAPFERIMATVGELGSGDGLRLITPFKPEPLMHAMRERGYDATVIAMEDGAWETRFVPGAVQAGIPDVESLRAMASEPGGGVGAGEVELDVRGLEPPEPMVRILERLATMPQGVVLKAFTDRRPMHLLAELQAGRVGFRCEELADGSWATWFGKGVAGD